MRVGSLCSGYGGLDMGLELALGPIEHAWHVEYDKHPSAILDHRFPGVPNHGDLTTLDHNRLTPIDWLTAGYPCQPFSQGGLRLGAADERHLWPYVADTIGRVRPRNVLLENVAGHVSLGLADVLGDLSALGYDARWGVVRASEAGAPHARARVFVVATDTDGGRQAQQLRDRGVTHLPVPGEHGSDGAAAHAAGIGRREGWAEHARVEGRPDAAQRRPALADADREGLEGREPAGGLLMPAWGTYEPAIRTWERVTGRPAPRPTEPGREGRPRLSAPFVEWLMGLPADWVTDVPGLPRSAQLKALGNGVVPQQAALALRLLGVTQQEAAA